MGASLLKAYVITYFLIIFTGCSSRDFAGLSDSSSSKSEDSEAVYQTEDLTAESSSGGVLDALSGGNGITIGNGQTNDAEIEDDNDAPEAVIIGGYLTCQILDSQSASCTSETPLNADNLADLILINSLGDAVPEEDFDVEFLETEQAYEMLIIVSENHKLASILDAEIVGSQSPEVDPEASRVESDMDDSGLGVEAQDQGTNTEASMIPVYRFHSTQKRDHMQGIIENEGSSDYVKEGISFYIFSRPVEGSHQIIRCVNSFKTNHYLRTIEEGCEFAHSSDGTIGYLLSDEVSGTAIYNCYRNDLFVDDSFSSTNPQECLDNGYDVMGVLGYAPN